MADTTRRSALFGSSAALLAPLALSACATVSLTQAAPAATSSIQFSTHQYASRGAQNLFLDVMYDASVAIAGRRPVIVFSFGGGWEGGDRGNQASNTPLFQEFLAQGYAIAAIDYRLGIKIAKEAGEFSEANGTEMYLRAIAWSVEDIFDATSFLLAHADEWNIDLNQIVLLGGSSGATNSLVAEFNVANHSELARTHLPDGFRYAGVVSMAGAFWLPPNTPLTFAAKPAPIMFFHGAHDQLVTYDEHQGRFSGYGPTYFFRAFAGPDYPKWFEDYPEGDHVLAALPLLTKQLEIRAFLQRLVRDRQEASIHTIEYSRPPATFASMLEAAREQAGRSDE